MIYELEASSVDLRRVDMTLEDSWIMAAHTLVRHLQTGLLPHSEAEIVRAEIDVIR
jgi:hypothetical protein